MMNTGKFLLLILAVLTNICCGNKSFDLSLVSLGEDAGKYDFENKNIFLKDVPEESDIIQYYADENKNIVYGEIPLDNTMGSRITVYGGKVGAVETYASQKYSLEFAEKVMEKNGKPTAVLTQTATLTDSDTATQIFEKIKKITSDKMVWDQERQNTFIYPYSFLWDDGTNYLILSISIEADGTIRNKYIVVTKEAYRSNAVYGLKYPTPKESPWYDYMK